MSNLSLRQRFTAWLMGLSHEQFASIVETPIKDNTPGFYGANRGLYDRPAGEAQKLYLETLEAWRENPQIKRIVDTVTDFVLGDGIRISSPVKSLDDFINRFVNHRKNREYMVELERTVEELTRAGDVFPLLWRNPADGMSYLRLVPKEQIQEIETLDNDPDEQIAYISRPTELGEEPKRWIGVHNKKEASKSDHIMLHYAINRPVGAQFGDSDLATILHWIQTYAQTLNGRAKLHWSMRLFYWIVKVPKNLVNQKRQQYAAPPPSGSIIVTDNTEEWQPVTPNLHGADAGHDLEALRHMIYAGTSFPALWLGESGSSNLAEAKEARGPAERHLKRRQNYVIWLLQDIIFHAYQRAVELGKEPSLPHEDYDQLFTVQVTEVSREDNNALAQAGASLSKSMLDLRQSLNGLPIELIKKFTGLWFKFIGEPLEDDELSKLVNAFFAKVLADQEAQESAAEEEEETAKEEEEEDANANA